MGNKKLLVVGSGPSAKNIASEAGFDYLFMNDAPYYSSFASIRPVFYIAVDPLYFEVDSIHSDIWKKLAYCVQWNITILIPNTYSNCPLLESLKTNQFVKFKFFVRFEYFIKSINLKL